MILSSRPTVQLEKWGGSQFTVSVMATSRTTAKLRAERWVERNVARQMQTTGDRPTRVVEDIVSGVGPVSLYYYEFKLKDQ